jgi:hypothetical protein
LLLSRVRRDLTRYYSALSGRSNANTSKSECTYYPSHILCNLFPLPACFILVLFVQSNSFLLFLRSTYPYVVIHNQPSWASSHSRVCESSNRATIMSRCSQTGRQDISASCGHFSCLTHPSLPALPSYLPLCALHSSSLVTSKPPASQHVPPKFLALRPLRSLHH